MVPKMPPKSGPIGGLPSIPANNAGQSTKKAGKKTLFDDEDEKPLVPEKKIEKKPTGGNRKNVFED